MIETNFSKLSFIMKDRDVVCIPIVSSINRKTGEYDLSTDGNVNRIITTYWHCNTMKSLTIFLPKKHVQGSEYLLEQLKHHIGDDKCVFIYSEHFGVHAGEQRKDPNVYRALIEDIKKHVNIDKNKVEYGLNLPLIMFSSQYVGMHLLNTYLPSEMIFWSEVAEIPNLDKSRSFLDGYDEMNLQLAKECKCTIVTSIDQFHHYNYVNERYHYLYNKIIYCPLMIDRSLPVFSYKKNQTIDDCLHQINKMDLKIFYLPYRLTDEGYQMDNVVDLINHSSINGQPEDCVVLYTDPNNSGVMENIKKKFGDNVKETIKVGTSRNIYYTILDSSVCVHIPYFEDLNFINHASIHEIIHAKNVTLYLWNDHYQYYIPEYLNQFDQKFYFDGKKIYDKVMIKTTMT